MPNDVNSTDRPQSANSSEIELTPSQSAALGIALSSENLEAVIGGFAGAGKSTVLAQASKNRPATITLAPTNKAAAVLRSKGIAAQTLHSFLYAPAETHEYRRDDSGKLLHHKDAAGNLILDENNQPIPIIASSKLSFQLREDAERLPLCFVDEASMLSEQQLADLHTVFNRVVLFGDTFQLPPVNAPDIFKRHKPDILLTEVHRTVADNPIMKLLTALRTPGYQAPASWQPIAEELRACDYNNRSLFRTLVEKNVQAICYSNSMRHSLNDRLREEAALPFNKVRKGEQLISLDNVRVTVEDKTVIKFYNGQLLTLAEDIEDPGSDFRPVLAQFTNGKTQMIWPFFRKSFWHTYEQNNKATWNNEILKLRATGQLRGQIALFDFSRAITCHKAQGSEWPLVAVFHQRSSMRRLSTEMSHRWLYTAFSRAKERLLIVNS